MEKILVIEDNKDILENICELLENKGYKTIGAVNIIDGERLVMEVSPDLVLCDIRMETEYDGFEFLKILQEKRINPLIPFIFLTALNDTKNIVKGLQMGAQDYIVKPYEREILLARIRIHLDLKKARLDLEKRNYELSIAKDNLEKVNKELTIIISELKETITQEELDKIVKNVFNKYFESDYREVRLDLITKDEAFALLSKNKYHDLFSILKVKSNEESKHLKEIILLESNYNQTISSFTAGVISKSEHIDEITRLNIKLFEVIDIIFK